MLNLDYIFYKIYLFFLWIGNLFKGAASDTPMTVATGLYYLKFFLSWAAVLFITVIIYSLVRMYELEREEKRKLKAIMALPPEELPKNETWQVVLDRVNSANPSDWKLAVMEADNMLDEMVKRMGYRGENLGERLKAIEPADFFSIQSAWEAHKLRNRIAHEANFELSQREARQAIRRYEEVFKEFKLI